ncbi:uncharacterized protein LOC126708247 [Quercus robur]|uniref:uncharacterized protein LOC126708247 n=1 Tax=Quercus robur TaxID=38942 RepID=UPI0021638B63|nr:uncharacterized protein LOC126708247 [Quercus robur]
MFNEINGDFDDVAIKTFKVSLPAEHGLKKSLTGKPAISDKGHTTDDCRTLWDHRDQLVREGRLKQFLYHPSGQGGRVRSEPRRDASSRAFLGIINVILTAPWRTGSHLSRVMSVAQPPTEDSGHEPKRARVEIRPTLSFSDNDKAGTIQPHDDALVVTLRIRRYDVKRVLVDQGSGAEIMYPDLYNGLNLKPEDLTSYDSPLVGFDRKVVIPKGQIRLPVQAGSEVVEMDFIVVDPYSPYTAIVARPWLHTLGAVSSTLHLKVKYPSGDQIKELVGSQFVARQCLVAAIMHQLEIKSSASTDRGL